MKKQINSNIMSNRKWRLLSYILVLVAGLLAVAGACAFLGEGTSIYRAAILDEDFVTYNALAMAYQKFSYSLDNWYGYRHYSLLPPMIEAVFLSICSFLWNIAGMNFLGNFDYVIFVARLPSAIAFVISLFLLHDLLLRRYHDGRLAFAGILIYVSIFGPLYVASGSRAEGHALPATMLLYWALFRFGPRPTRKQWWVIALLAGIPSGVELYGSVMASFSLFFFMAGDRYLEWKETGLTRRFFVRSALLFSFVASTAFMTALILNMRALITPLTYLRQIKWMTLFAKGRIWEASVTWGVGNRGGIIENLLYIFEFLFPILIVALLYVAMRDFREKRYSWWLFTFILGCLYWEMQSHSHSVKVYLILPLLPLCVVMIMDMAAASKKAIFYLVLILGVIGFARVSTLQIARYYDRSYYDAYRFILDDAKGREGTSITEYGMQGQSHVTQKIKEEEFKKNYAAYFLTVPPYPPTKNSLVLPGSWSASDSNPRHWYDRDKAQKLVDDFLAKGTGQYDYVVIDSHFRWYQNRWCHARNPELAEKWREMDHRLREGRVKIFETGGIDSRFSVQGSSAIPAWSWTLAGEYLDWYYNREHRKSLFGPLVEVYKKPPASPVLTGKCQNPPLSHGPAGRSAKDFV